MSHESFSLTKNEHQIMELLWSQERSLSRAEIIELSENRSWRAGSIHILLNQLLEKGAIQVDGFVKTGKNYGRTFAAVISQDDYQMMQFKSIVNQSHSKASTLISLVSALVQEEDIDKNTLDELEALLQAKKGKKK